MSSPAALESKDADMEVLKGRIKDVSFNNYTHLFNCSSCMKDNLK